MKDTRAMGRVAFRLTFLRKTKQLNISKLEQRTLHVLARGGAIHFERHGNGKIQSVTCFTREGHILSDCTLDVFQRLKKRRFVKSVNGQPYRATHRGLRAVNAQLDNR